MPTSTAEFGPGRGSWLRAGSPGERRVGLGLALIGFAAARLYGAQPASHPVVEYRIEATLDPKAKTVAGKEHLIWRNPSADSVSELRFHLYLNAFKNNRSTFLRESGGRLRTDRAGPKPEDWGAIDVLSIATADGRDLRPGARFVQPDGNDPTDETVLSVPLPSPVPPYGEIALDIAFRDKLPHVFARTGFVRDFFLVGQWFPKIGVYEPAGMRHRARGGWNCHAFHAHSEFYADFGTYDVTITAPSSFVVGATGVKISETKSGGTTTHRYRQENVHDFAWTADPRYLVVEARFDPKRDVPAGWSALASRQLGLSQEALALRPVSIRLLLQPHHARARERYIRSIVEGIAFYGLWFGPYPYETLTVVDPPEDGAGAGGMEYPTFITGGTPSFGLGWPLTKVRFLEDVTIHEFGHQYFYGMVASNEFEEPWLDEGLNSDAEYRAMELAYGPRAAELPGGIGFGLDALAHLEYFSLPNLDPIRRVSWGFFSGGSYGVNSYTKVALFLAQLRNDLGAETFARAQRAYFEEWSFRHPDTTDFFDVFERVAGRDLSTYRRNLVEGTALLDWSVVRAETRRALQDEGLFDRNGGRVTLKDGATERDAKKPAKRKKETYESVVVFGNVGEWPHDVRVRLVFEDGKTLDRTLPADARWVRLRVRYGSRLAWAAADPDRENAWEWKRQNDSKVLGTGKRAADTRGFAATTKYLSWAAHFAAFFQQLLWALA
jgi:peptidase M1-like protein